MAHKKKAGTPSGEVGVVEPELSIEQTILEHQTGKYEVVPIAAEWARELKRRQEFQHLTIAELLEAALKDVLGGKVDWKTVEGLRRRGEAETEPKAKK